MSQADTRHSDGVTAWFARRRLGLFLHFGLYALEGWHEQDQMRRRIPRAAYGQLRHRFNPNAFDPDAILDLAQRVGMEYVCLTTKHHDGFCLWATRQTDFNVMRSPYGRDLVGQFAAACHRRNFPLGLYYSVVDWHHPNYPNQGRHHELPGPEAGDVPDWDRYRDFLMAQVRELCTNYGQIRQFFWDMNVPEVRDPAVNAMIRSLQPNIVINDRGFDDGDFGTPEREYQKAATDESSGFDRPTEACNSVGTQSWGYRHDEDYYASSFLIQSIDAMMARGAHYLLNVGPDASGRIPAAATAILADIGRWYGAVRESFADTRPCPGLTTNPAVILSHRGNTVYVHLKHPIRADAILLPPVTVSPVRAVLLNNGAPLVCTTDVLPSYWAGPAPVLRIKGLPREILAGGETPVIRLDFGQALSDGGPAGVAFQG